MGMESRVTKALTRKTGGRLDVKESQDSRTNDHTSFGHRVNDENWPVEEGDECGF